MCLRLYCKTIIYHNKNIDTTIQRCIKNKKIATYTHLNRLLERYTSIIKYTLIYKRQG